eukprot:1612927-Prymnesium_polylepis.1
MATEQSAQPRPGPQLASCSEAAVAADEVAGPVEAEASRRGEPADDRGDAADGVWAEGPSQPPS